MGNNHNNVNPPKQKGNKKNKIKNVSLIDKSGNEKKKSNVINDNSINNNEITLDIVIETLIRI